jgi:hypothetical protein
MNDLRDAFEKPSEEPSALRSPAPVRTLRLGERVRVFGDVEIIAVEGRRVTIRVHPLAEGLMIPLKRPLSEGRT